QYESKGAIDMPVVSSARDDRDVYMVGAGNRARRFDIPKWTSHVSDLNSADHTSALHAQVENDRELVLRFWLEHPCSYSVVVYDALGRVACSHRGTGEAGANRAAVAITGLPNG